MQNEETTPQKEQTPQPKPSFWSRLEVDRSDVIAVIALIVSLVGTLVAVRETSILQEQQDVAMAQKAASVLPYLSTSLNVSYKNDSLLSVTFSISNDGIGPAFLSKLELFYGSVALDADELTDYVKSQHPEIKIYGRQSNQMTEGVIPAGTSIQIFDIVINFRGVSPEVLEEISDKFTVAMCYCNVYGDCWKYQENDWAVPTKDCEVPMQL